MDKNIKKYFPVVESMKKENPILAVVWIGDWQSWQCDPYKFEEFQEILSEWLNRLFVQGGPLSDIKLVNTKEAVCQCGSPQAKVSFNGEISKSATESLSTRITEELFELWEEFNESQFEGETNG